jgi:hypothetical protein
MRSQRQLQLQTLENLSGDEVTGKFQLQTLENHSGDEVT